MIDARPNDFILMDAGAQYGGYITDITRTWPNNGTFSPAQKDLYLAVLSVQRHAVSMCRQNADTTLDKIHDAAEKMLKENLRDLGFNVAGNVSMIFIMFGYLPLCGVGADRTHATGNEYPVSAPYRPLHRS